MIRRDLHIGIKGRRPGTYREYDTLVRQMITDSGAENSGGEFTYEARTYFARATEEQEGLLRQELERQGIPCTVIVAERRVRGDRTSQR